MWARGLEAPDRMVDPTTRRVWVQTLPELAQATGINHRTLKSWNEAGKLPPKSARGWNVPKMLRAWDEARQAEEDGIAAGNGQDGDGLERWRLAKAEREELLLAKLKGELLDTEVVRECLREMVNAFAVAIRNIESHALDDCGLEGADLKTFADRLGARLDEAITGINQTLGELEVMR